MRMLRLCCLILAAANAGVVWAQHEAMSPDAQAGASRYMSTCAVCHGIDGDEVEGVNLARGQFRRAESDEDLVNIIINGIPGTAMPPNNVSPGRAAMIVAYLRYLASQPPLTGDAERGRAVVEGKGNCLRCHRIKGVGSRLGPDLTEVGLNRRGSELELALLDPDAEILPQNRLVRVVTQDGRTMTGRLLNHDIFTAQLITADKGLVSLDKSKLREFSVVEKSPMPSMRGRLTDEETADVVRYLASLRGIETR